MLLFPGLDLFKHELFGGDGEVGKERRKKKVKY